MTFNNDLLLVARSWYRRSKSTSVERFLAYFPHSRIVSNADAPKHPERLLKLLSRRAGHDGYSSLSAGIEIAALRSIIRARPRIVHFLYADHDYHYLGRIARRFGVKMVGTFWFSIEELERRMPDKTHLRYLDLVVTSGRKQMDYLSRFVEPDKLAYLPLGVDCGFFHPPESAEQRLQAPLQILQVGINRRDFPTMRAAFQTLYSAIPGIELHMVGCQEAKPEFEGLPGVVFYPLLNDEEFLAVYQRSALLVLPLLEGGSSNALNEALASGLPVVATHMPNLEDYASEDCVFFCPPSDANSMADACVQLLTDRARWTAASQSARCLGERFDWQNVQNQLFDLYQQHFGITIST